MNFKRTIIIAITFILFSLLFVKSVEAKTATVNVDALNLREKESTTSDVVKSLKRGTELEVLEEDSDWLKVKAGNDSGYVKKEYVKISDDDEIPVGNENPFGTGENTVDEENTTGEETQKDTETDKKQTTSVTKEGTLKVDTKIAILPLINATRISEVEKDTKVKVIDETNTWVYIQTSKINGWVLKDSLEIEESAVSDNKEDTSEDNTKTDETEGSVLTGTDDNTQEKSKVQVDNTTTETTAEDTKIDEKTMYVNYSSVYVRKEPTTDSQDIDSLVLNDEVTVIAESGDWYKVKLSNGTTGYIAKRLLSNNKQETTTRNSEERNTSEVSAGATSGASSKGQEIVNYAKQYLGYPYSYGASGSSSFDCSGFTLYVYKNFGISLPHSATAQSKLGTQVSKDDLDLGDLVFFTDYETNVGIGHVGIYIGGGKVIHASSGTGYCVKESSIMSGSYANRYETATRLI